MVLALVGAVVALGLWGALLGVLVVASRIPPVRAGVATGALGPESPAVVDLLTGDWTLSDEAASATLLDLAARRVVTLEEIGPELSLVRLGRDEHALSPYEQLVLDHVRGLATADGVVATGALAEGARDLGAWWKAFGTAVVAEARAAGLSRARWSGPQRALLLGTATVPAATVGTLAAVVLSTPDDGPVGSFVGGAIVLFALLAGLVSRVDREVGTAAGAAAAGRWLGVREHLAAGRLAEARPRRSRCGAGRSPTPPRWASRAGRSPACR